MADPLADEPQTVDRLLKWVDHHRRWCFASVGLLYAAGFNGQWRMGSDSALYMNVARNLAEGLGYTHEGSINRLVYPGLPWLLALLSNVGGVNAYALMTFVMLILGLMAMALTYRLFRLHGDRATAVWVTCLTGIAYTFYHYAFEVLSDMLFCVGVMSLLAGYEGLSSHNNANRPTRHRLAWVVDWLLLAGGLLVAVATRPTMWVLAAALAATSVWCLIRGQRRVVHGIIIAAMALGVAAFLIVDPRRSAANGVGATGLPDYERWLVSQLQQLDLLWNTVVTRNIPRFFEPHLAEAVFGLELGPGLNTVAGLIILALGVNLCRKRLLWGMWFTLLIAAMLIAEPAVRYTLPLIPLVAFAWWHAIVHLEHRLGHPRGAQVAVALLLLWCVPNLVRVSNFVLHQRQTPFLQTYKAGRYAPLVDLGEKLVNVIDDEAVIISEYSYELSYFSRRPVMHTSVVQAHQDGPTRILSDLLAANRTVYLVASNDKQAQTAASAMRARLGQRLKLTEGPPPSAGLYRVLGNP